MSDKERVKCELCEAYIYTYDDGTTSRHGMVSTYGESDVEYPFVKFCPNMSLQERANMAELYYKQWLKNSSTYQSHVLSNNSKVTYWQGKFHMIKTENNALRKANKQLLKRIERETEGCSV